MFSIYKTKSMQLIKRNTPLPIYLKNRENVTWRVPSLFHYDDIIFLLLDDLKQLGIKPTINSVYGSVKTSWGGGRPSGWPDVEKKAAESTIHRHNENQTSCCFTFSNYHITKEDLEDKTANLLLEVASEGSFQNYAIVSSDLLADYIREKFPKIKLISSVLKPIYEIENFQDTPQYYNDLCKRFDRVTLRPELSFDYNFLKKLTNKDKIDLIVNQDCLPNCPLYRKHYDFYSEVERGIKQRSEDFCHLEKRKVEAVYNTSLLSNQDMDKMIQLGFKNFKLKGRSLTKSQVIDLLGYYIFEPSGLYQNLKYRIILKVLGP